MSNKSGSLSWDNKYNSLPFEDERPWPAKNTIKSDLSFTILLFNHLFTTLLVSTNVASSSTKIFIFLGFTPNPFLA